MDRLEQKFDAMYGPERYLCSVAAIGAVATVAGAGISASGASKGGKAQVTAARAAGLAEEKASKDALRIQQFNLDRTRADSAPWVNAGEGALNQLAWKLGVQPTNRIDPNFTRSREDIVADLQASGKYDEIWGKRMDLKRTDYGRLNAEADRLFAEQKTKQAEAQAYPEGDPGDFGSLNRNFTMADRDADPVYQSGLQFGLDEGRKAYERQGAASGSQLSGATLKALTRYGNDYGSTKAQGSYERFNNNQTNQYNRLAGLSGTGQQQVNQIGAAGQSFANNAGNYLVNAGQSVANNTLAAGQARASTYQNQANAWNNALGGITNMYQQNQMLDRFFPKQSGGSAPWGSVGSGAGSAAFSGLFK